MKLQASTLPLLGLLATLASCSGTPTPLVSTDLAMPLPERVRIVSGLPDGDAEPQLVADFTSELAGQLGARGVTNQNGSPYSLTVAISVSPADVGITQSNGESHRKIDWLARPKRSGGLGGCRKQRLRAVVYGTDGRFGGEHRIAEGALLSCAIGSREIVLLSQEVAKALTRR